jgi:hypothetical protein
MALYCGINNKDQNFLEVIQKNHDIHSPDGLRASHTIALKGKGGSRLMRISLVQIPLLRFFKTFHNYLPYANFGLYTSLLRFFCQNI